MLRFDAIYGIFGAMKQVYTEKNPKHSNVNDLNGAMRLDSTPQKPASTYKPARVATTTFFGRNPKMNETLIAYFQRKQAIAKDGEHYKIIFPCASALCEPFYFAMLAKEAGLLKNDFLKIHATDVREPCLNFGKRGIYPKSSIFFLENGPLKKYFSSVPDLDPKSVPDNIIPVSLSAFDASAFSDLVKVSKDIIDAVQIEPAGDIRDNANHKEYDAVVVTNVLFHFNKKAQRQILQSAMCLSKGLVVTDYASFEESSKPYGQAALDMNFGNADANLNFSPAVLTNDFNILQRFGLQSKSLNMVDLHNYKKDNAFFMVQNPEISSQDAEEYNLAS